MKHVSLYIDEEGVALVANLTVFLTVRPKNEPLYANCHKYFFLSSSFLPRIQHYV